LYLRELECECLVLLACAKRATVFQQFVWVVSWAEQKRERHERLAALACSGE
jgi:hypothetical protein